MKQPAQSKVCSTPQELKAAFDLMREEQEADYRDFIRRQTEALLKENGPRKEWFP
jgi:hypothetical protein